MLYVHNIFCIYNSNKFYIFILKIAFCDVAHVCVSTGFDDRIHLSMSIKRRIKNGIHTLTITNVLSKSTSTFQYYSHVLECWSLITLLFVEGGRLDVELVIFFVFLSFSSLVMLMLLSEKVFLLWTSFFLGLVSCLPGPKPAPVSTIFDEDFDLVVVLSLEEAAVLFWFKGAVDLVFNVARDFKCLRLQQCLNFAKSKNV